MSEVAAHLMHNTTLGALDLSKNSIGVEAGSVLLDMHKQRKLASKSTTVALSYGCVC